MRAYVSRFHFKGEDQQKHVSELCGGARIRVHLAKLLQSSGNVLLLSEAANHLDVERLRAGGDPTRLSRLSHGHLQ